MEQYARKRSFSTIVVGQIDNLARDEDQRTRGVHPLLILPNFLADPQTSLNTKTLIIGSIDGTGYGGFEDQEE